MKFCPSNPAYNCIFKPSYKQCFSKKEKSIKPFGFWMELILEESKISLTNIHKTILPKTRPWIIKKRKFILELSEHPKTKTHPSTYQDQFHDILEHHSNHFYIFTDEFKDNDKTVCTTILIKNYKKSSFKGKLHLFKWCLCNRSSTRHHLWKQPRKINFSSDSICLNITKKSNKKTPWSLNYWVDYTLDLTLKRFLYAGYKSH